MIWSFTLPYHSTKTTIPPLKSTEITPKKLRTKSSMMKRAMPVTTRTAPVCRIAARAVPCPLTAGTSAARHALPLTTTGSNAPGGLAIARRYNCGIPAAWRCLEYSSRPVWSTARARSAVVSPTKKSRPCGPQTSSRRKRPGPRPSARRTSSPTSAAPAHPAPAGRDRPAPGRTRPRTAWRPSRAAPGCPPATAGCRPRPPGRPTDPLPMRRPTTRRPRRPFRPARPGPGGKPHARPRIGALPARPYPSSQSAPPACGSPARPHWPATI